MHGGAPDLTPIQMQEASANTQKLLSKEPHKPSRMPYKPTQERAGEMVQWVKAFASKLDNLGSRSGTHSMEGEK